MFMSGGSRGIGLAIAARAARDGAKVALMAKTAEPHPKLPGTIYTAAEEIEAAGGQALPIVGDIRDAEAVEAAVAQTVERFGGIDLVVNNASAINLAPMRDLEVKRFDLMQQINARGTFVVTRACLPHLRESDHAHVLTLSPPLSADPRWLNGHSAYTLSKMGMTMITLGVAADEAEAGIGANCLWPRTIIATAAVQNLLGGDEAMARSRVPAIVADAALRDPEPRPALVHRERLHRRRGPGGGGHHRPRPVRGHARRRAGARHLRERLARRRSHPLAAAQSITKPTITRVTRPFFRKKAVMRWPGRPSPRWQMRVPSKVSQLTPGTRFLTADSVERTPTPLAVRSPRPVVCTAVTVC